MSVVMEVALPPDGFRLGRLLPIGDGTRVELERAVPLGGTQAPLIWVHGADGAAFERSVGSDPSVGSIRPLESFEDRTLYVLAWDLERDAFLSGIADRGGQLLGAVGAADGWEFEVRFPDREALSAFRVHCRDAGVPVEVLRVFDPSHPGVGPWYGLTDPQREALLLAVREGYYAVPRECTTIELAERLGISDQAVTERLRRAIETLTRNTLLVGEG